MLRFPELLAIGVVALVCAVGAWVASKSMKKAYQSSAVVMMAGQAEGGALSALASQIGGVTALLGTGGGTSDKLNEALATLRSHWLARTFISADDRLTVLEAAVWPADRSKLPLDERLDAAASVLRSQVLTVSDDLRAGTIRVSVTWFDPAVAAKWANGYVSLADQTMRERAINDARRSIAFLKAAADKAESLELRQAVFRVIESQINSEMLAATRPEYSLRVIDPASVPRGHIRPKSWLIGVAGGVFGAMIGFCAIVLLRWRRDGRLPRSAARAEAAG